MPSDIASYTALKTVCSYALDEEDKSSADLDKVWLLGIRAMADLLFDFAGQTITVRLPVLGNKTVPFPADYVSWSKVGILNEKGEINTLKVNNALTTFRDNNPNRLQNLTPDINNGVGNVALVPYYSNFYYGGSCYQLYGLDNGIITYGDCKIDEINKVVILNEDFKYSSIMFEYINAPEKNNDYQILTCLQEAVIAFIKWKLKLGSRDEYYAAATSARRRMPKKKFILQSATQVIRESDGMKLRS